MNSLSELVCFADLMETDADRFAELTGPNGPALWRGILDRIGCPGAVIAGGAVRDLLLGVRPKDIDIFAPSDGFNPPSIFQGLGDERHAEYEAMPSIDIVMRAEIAGFQVDLVGCQNFSNGMELVETFDFGVSRCWFDGQQLFDTMWAQHDRKNKVVTLLLNDRRERAQRRFDRFNERMGGGWTLVEADSL